MNEVIHGDCLEVMQGLPEQSFDLVYLDPPFFTGLVLKQADNSFDDRWDDIESYLEFMRQRLGADSPTAFANRIHTSAL